MSLRVWLPLNGTLDNQGLDDYNIEMVRGSEIYDSRGKIGKCFYSNGVNTIKIKNIIPDFYQYNEYSLSVWCYVESQNPSHSGSAIVSGGNWNQQLINLAVSDWSSDHYTKLRISGINWSKWYPYDFYLNTWYHIVVECNQDNTLAYVNGILIGNTVESFLPTNIQGNDIYIGGATYYAGMQFFGKINDVRIYDHALSPMEVKQISQGLILHYPLNRNGWGQENLFALSDFNNISTLGSPLANASRPLAIYNGNISLHTFSNGVDTISLNSGGNIGICFVRLATDINLDTSSYYTISCWSKCSKINAHLDIGLSYYNNSDTGVWRGGTGSQNYKAINTWQYFTRTFKPDTDTKAICYCFTVVGTSGSTDTFSIKQCKLEKGSKATPWCPNSADELATILGLNNNIQYDTSGYGNNGTRIGTFDYDSDTPKYNVSTYAQGSSSTYLEGVVLPAEAKTVSLWVKCAKTVNSAIFNDRIVGLQIGLLNSLLYVNSLTSTKGFTTTHWKNNEWNHVVVINDNGVRHCYVNGQAETQSGATNYYIHNTDKFWVWKRSYNDNYTFKGSLSDLRIYCTALSEKDVLSLYNNSAYIDNQGNIYGAVYEEV